MINHALRVAELTNFAPEIAIKYCIMLIDFFFFLIENWKAFKNMLYNFKESKSKYGLVNVESDHKNHYTTCYYMDFMKRCHLRYDKKFSYSRPVCTSHLIKKE